MKRQKRKLDGIDIVSMVILTASVLLIVFPFYTSLVTSFATSASYLRKPVQLFPESFTWGNYQYVLTHLSILDGYKNTMLVVGVGTIISMSISLMFSYGLAMRNYPGKKIAFLFLLITMYFSGGLIPTYMLIRNLNLINNPMAIVFLCGVSPFNIIIMKNGMEALPQELSEAARIDGAGEGRIFVEIIIPLIKPIVVTFTLFTAVAYWNEWYWSMIILTRGESKTLQVMLRDVVTSIDAASLESMGSVEGMNVFSQGLKMAAVMITMLPIMLVYPFVQKHFTKGILVGAVKM